MKVQKAGFQNRAGGENFGKTKAQVYIIGTREPYFPKLASDATPTKLRQPNQRYQSPLFELPLKGELLAQLSLSRSQAYPVARTYLFCMLQHLVGRMD